MRSKNPSICRQPEPSAQAPLNRRGAKLSRPQHRPLEWPSSVGERPKFGLSVPDLLAHPDNLAPGENLARRIAALLHLTTWGSQYQQTSAVLRTRTARKAGQIYVQLAQLRVLARVTSDVGRAGLGIDYDAAAPPPPPSTNYSLQKTTPTDVVATVQRVLRAPRAIP